MIYRYFQYFIRNLIYIYIKLAFDTDLRDNPLHTGGYNIGI